MITGGSLSDKYTCVGGPSSARFPSFQWAGMPKNTGVRAGGTRSSLGQEEP